MLIEDPKKKAKNRKKLRTISLIVAIGVGACIVTGAIQNEKESGYRSIAKDFVEQTYQEEDNSLYLGEYNDDYTMKSYQEEAIPETCLHSRQ